MELDPETSLKEYVGRVVRVFKEEQYSCKALILRVLNEEGRREIVFVRYLKNSKSKWIDLKDTESDKESGLSFKLDQIKGVATYDSLRNMIYPKTRMILPYVFAHHDGKIKIFTEEKWKNTKDGNFESGIKEADENKAEEI